MKWITVLTKWKNGNYPKFSKVKKEYIWKTSSFYDDSNFKEEIIYSPGLKKPYDYSSFSKKINGKDKYVTSFSNLSGDTILIIPIPIKKKDYSNIFKFNQNASKTQKKMFWKKVANIAIKEQKKHGNVFISTHGFGVPWLHVRISKQPKYYGNSKMLK